MEHFEFTDEVMELLSQFKKDEDQN
jgi:hypothetical protein